VVCITKDGDGWLAVWREVAPEYDEDLGQWYYPLEVGGEVLSPSYQVLLNFVAPDLPCGGIKVLGEHSCST
jgi:hypothetical protein